MHRPHRGRDGNEVLVPLPLFFRQPVADDVLLRHADEIEPVLPREEGTRQRHLARILDAEQMAVSPVELEHACVLGGNGLFRRWLHPGPENRVGIDVGSSGLPGCQRVVVALVIVPLTLGSEFLFVVVDPPLRHVFVVDTIPVLLRAVARLDLRVEFRDQPLQLRQRDRPSLSVRGLGVDPP